MSPSGRTLQILGGGLLKPKRHTVLGQGKIVPCKQFDWAGRVVSPSVVAANQKRFFAGKDGDDAKPKKRQAKVKKKGASSGGSMDEISSGNKTYQKVVACLNAPKTFPPPASEEEMERRFRIGRNYVIGSFQEHNEQEHMLSCKIRLKQHAISMLPRSSENPVIRKDAMIETDEGPPKNRRIPYWTPPPSKSFKIEDFVKEDEKSQVNEWVARGNRIG